jgi:uncharacterized protein (TIGR02118 family)
VYKTYLFLESDTNSDPFRYKGAEAGTQFDGVIKQAAGYTQTRTLSEQITDRGVPPFCGIAELWFADAASALDSNTHAEAIQTLLKPGTRVGPIVTGRARTVLRLAAHHQGGLIKGVFPFRRKADLEVANFQQYWWLNHGPIAALTEGAVYYLQCHPLPETYARGRPPYDGITELHWPDTATASAAMSSRQMTEDQATDAQNFVEPGSVVLFLAAEEIVRAA